MRESSLHHIAYLSLGSNLGIPEDNLNQAIELMNSQIGKVQQKSSYYKTKPVGFVSENMFLNAVCQVQTALSPLELLYETQRIEEEMGRVMKSVNKVYSDRIIDIDILFYDDFIFNDSSNGKLIIPHPQLHKRAFVLDPLLEIAPELVHPLIGKTINELHRTLDR